MTPTLKALKDAEAALNGLKAACIDVLLPTINDAINGGYKMEKWSPDQFQWSQAVENTDLALTSLRSAIAEEEKAIVDSWDAATGKATP